MAPESTDAQVVGHPMNHVDIVRAQLAAIGEDPTRDGLRDTPGRVARSWADLYAGYRDDPAKILGTVFEETYDEMVVLRDIEFFSTCEHHLLPFFGRAHIGYVPKLGKVVGLSKLARLVECFSRRVQIQERMTKQIGEAIEKHLDALGVAVVVEAQHFCMMARGVRRSGAVMSTSFVNGCLRSNNAARAEFFSLVKR